MKKCKCGHVHCCHENRIEEEIQTIERARPCKFTRESCADCGDWLTDGSLHFLDL